MSKHDKVSFTITKGGSNRGRGKNVPTTWKGFREFIQAFKRSDETMQQYIEASQDERNAIKASNGWYQGCATEGGHRTAQTLYPRQIITCDIDEPPVELANAILTGTHYPLNEYEYVAHSTKSSTKRKPKLRVIILSEKPIKPDHFRNLCTLVCLVLIDPTLNAVDDVSFRPAQLMYGTVVSKNQEFQYYHNEGRVLDPYNLAELWGIEHHDDLDAWQNYALIPASERQGKRRETAGKAQPPREKDNIVGAFCRAFSCEDAIEEFGLPYEPTEGEWGKPRYTYIDGSGSGGVVVQDNGDFIFSHHQSDPCGEQLVNAFDMVRLHKFGDQDKEAKDDTPPQKMPSFLEMQKLALTYEAVKAELLATRIDADAIFGDEDVVGGSFEDSLPEDADEVDHAFAAAADEVTAAEREDLEFLGFAKPSGPPKDFIKKLDVTQDGIIKVTLPNISMIVQNDPRFWNKIGVNEMTGHKYLRQDIITRSEVVPALRVRDRQNGDLFSDYHANVIRAILEGPTGKGKAGYGLQIPDRQLQAAIDITAMRGAYHPVRDFLSSVRWDGVPRLETLFIRYLGLADTPYHRAVARLTMLAAIVRVFEPGHKFDYAPVLEGITGIGKSTFIRALAMNRWFAELTADMSDAKACVEQMKGGWLFMELPELAGMSRADVNDVKSFITRQSDIVRLAYGREPVEWRRQCVFIGSTNDTEYLRDPTGNRRFWPIKVTVSTIDIHSLAREMPQVYAEAHVLYEKMRAEHPFPAVLPLYLADREAAREAYEAQETARIFSAEEELAGRIQDWLDTPAPLSVVGDVDEAMTDGSENVMVLRTRVCGQYVWEKFMGKNPDDYDNRAAAMIRNALNHLSGFKVKAGTRYDSYGQQRWRVRVDADGREVARGWKLAKTDDFHDLI